MSYKLRKIIKTVKHVVELLVRREFERLSKEGRADSLSPELIEFGVSEYPGTLIIPPESAYSKMDICGLDDIDNKNGLVCTIEFPLWTEDEGESQLSLLLTLYESQKEIYEYNFDDLDVT